MIRVSMFLVGLAVLIGCSPTTVEYESSRAPWLSLELRRCSTDSAEGWKSILFSPVGASTAETLYISPSVEISNADLKSTSIQQDTTGTWVIVLRLHESARSRFGEFSTKLAAETEHRERLAVIVDGKTLIAPYVTAPMTDGVISVTGPFTEEEARYIAKGIVGS